MPFLTRLDRAGEQRDTTAPQHWATTSSTVFNESSAFRGPATPSISPTQRACCALRGLEVTVLGSCFVAGA